MNFIYKPSLQHIAIVKIVTTLMSHDDINTIVQNKDYETERLTLEKIENQLIEKVKTISLPELLESKVLGAIKPMYDEIHVWKDYHTIFGYYSDITDFVKYHKLVWTSQGTVDKRKTAEIWIRIEEIDLDLRFRLACMYCLEEDIQTLWNQMTEDLKQLLYSNEIDELDLVFKLVTPGNTGLNERMPHERSESEQYQIEFLHAASQRNTVAVEYYWRKLEPHQKEDCLVRTAESAVNGPYWNVEDGLDNDYYLGETLCFLLSQMTDKQQIEVFEICPYSVLNSLLEWPRQNFFLETLKITCHFLKEYDYRLLVFQNVLYKINLHYTDCNYLEIFEECWKRSTVAHKKFVFNDHTGLCLLFSLFQVKDKKCIELVLKDATAEEKGNLICSQSNLIYKLLFASEEWDLLEIFMRECISSKDEMTKPIECLSPYKSPETITTEIFHSILEAAGDIQIYD